VPRKAFLLAALCLLASGCRMLEVKQATFSVNLNVNATVPARPAR